MASFNPLGNDLRAMHGIKLSGLTSIHDLRHHRLMRTTLALEDDAMQAIKTYAETHDLSLGKAASELIRRGMCYRIQTVKRNGLTVFDVPDHVPPITSEQIYKILDEE